MLCLAWPAAPAWAMDVALELVLAVDCSASVEYDEFDLQMRGLADAFRAPDVVRAIGAAAPNGIAVILVQWSGASMRIQVIPWRRAHDSDSAKRFAALIEATPRQLGLGATAIGEVLIYALGLFEGNGFNGLRRGIDLSGDGRSNQGELPTVARPPIVAAGGVINGLAILNDVPTLDQYYRRQVIGGERSFVLAARDFVDFADAIRRKLIREIGHPPMVRRATRTAAASPWVAGQDDDRRHAPPWLDEGFALTTE